VPEPILAALVLLTRPTPFGKRIKTLLPTGVGELSAALTEEDHAEDFASLPEGTRFMAGSLSPEYFRVTAQRLHTVVSGSTYEESPKLWHGAVPAAMKELIDDIAEYFTVLAALSTDDVSRIEGYLAHKWALTGNLPSDHPYKTEPPYA
jgi:hypothetical protein